MAGLGSGLDRDTGRYPDAAFYQAEPLALRPLGCGRAGSAPLVGGGRPVGGGGEGEDDPRAWASDVDIRAMKAEGLRDEEIRCALVDTVEVVSGGRGWGGESDRW